MLYEVHVRLPSLLPVHHELRVFTVVCDPVLSFYITQREDVGDGVGTVPYRAIESFECCLLLDPHDAAVAF